MEQIKPLRQVDIELNKALLIWYKKQFELRNKQLRSSASHIGSIGLILSNIEWFYAHG